jgi:hypothetical protein
VRRRLSLVLIAGALLAETNVRAQEPVGPSELEQSLGRPRRVPTIPAELRPMFREVTRDRIIVRDLRGADIAIDISDFEPESFRQFGDGRFLGFAFTGYEFYGYRLIDRRMTGEAGVIETGEAPVFSPDGRYFAAVQLSGAELGGLEGLGIWEVRADDSAQILFSDVLPQGEEWRIDGWPRADCVSVSSIERQAGDGEPPPARRHFGVEVGEMLRFLASGNFPGCNAIDATTDG